MEQLGSVDNIEQYLETDWWRKIFNAMYLKTDADVVQDEQVTSKEIDMLIETLNPDPAHTILDLACGQGRHLIGLRRRGYMNLHGLDRSAFLIGQARQHAEGEHKHIHFREGDARNLPYATDQFNYVTILGNSFGYFESKEDDRNVLREVLRVLKPGGKLLMDVADGSYLKEHFSPRSWEWIDNKHFVCRERALAADHERLISREVVTNVDEGVIVDQFYAERLYSRQQLSDMLDAVGFRNITHHSTLETQSSRNQDLGMMRRRSIFTATACKTSVHQKNGQKVKRVGVIMGDPSIHDRVKPDGVFDADDFETIRKLKDSLCNLKKYNFQYLSDHSSLIDDVKKLKGSVDFVLNLCDEGFNNEAIKELHVPALLEMMDIPYTGSAPQNLAYCYDKSLIRSIATQIDVPVADALIVKPGQTHFETSISFPVICKPNYGDSSFGITRQNVAYSMDELHKTVQRIRGKFGCRKPIVVEKFLTGAELTVGIIGNPPEEHTILPIIQEDYSELPDDLPKICGYEAKWLPESPYFTKLKSIPASLPDRIEQQIKSGSVQLFERLECRDYSRFDWRLDAEGNPHLLEVNPNPGWCWDGHLARMSEIAGINYAKMLEAILQAAEARITKARNQSQARPTYRKE